MKEKYNVTVLPLNCLELNESKIKEILQEILFEFPIKEINLDMPKWINILKIQKNYKQM